MKSPRVYHPVVYLRLSDFPSTFVPPPSLGGALLLRRNILLRSSGTQSLAPRATSDVVERTTAEKAVVVAISLALF